jgi:DNA-binding NtrC family response regulator
MSSLDGVVEKKIKPMLDSAMQKYLGIAISEVRADISDKLKKSSLFIIDTSVPFKEAKKRFKEQYIVQLLHKYRGNISEVARMAGIDRRSLHRLIAEFKIDVVVVRDTAPSLQYVRREAVRDIIEHALDKYKDVLSPGRLEDFYKHTSSLSQNIVKSLPEDPLSLKEAVIAFEKKYVQQALKEHNHNISKTARAIGLRFESLHRKMKQIGL